MVFLVGLNFKLMKKPVMGYVNHINWDYPIIRSIYKTEDTIDIDVTIYNPYAYGDNKNDLGNLSLDNNSILFTDEDTGEYKSNYELITEEKYNSSVDGSGIKSYTKDENGSIVVPVIKFVYTIYADDLFDITVTNEGADAREFSFGASILGDGYYSRTVEGEKVYFISDESMLLSGNVMFSEKTVTVEKSRHMQSREDMEQFVDDLGKE